MKNEDNSRWGARIERGRVTAAYEDANSPYIPRYDVESIDRPGVKVRGLTIATDEMCAIDQMVYFFAFDDGKGMVIGGIR